MNERYNSIYYCQRDDVVFIPGEEEALPASDFVQFLFKPLVKKLCKLVYILKRKVSQKRGLHEVSTLWFNGCKNPSHY